LFPEPLLLGFFAMIPSLPTLPGLIHAAMVICPVMSRLAWCGTKTCSFEESNSKDCPPVNSGVFALNAEPVPEMAPV
jgi:hypothetical protein